MRSLGSTAFDTLTRFGAGAGLFFAWTLFEKFILEPSGLYRFLPFYRVSGPCIWDLLAISAIVVAFLFLGRRRTGFAG